MPTEDNIALREKFEKLKDVEQNKDALVEACADQ